jgi:hypothetical protein
LPNFAVTEANRTITRGIMSAALREGQLWFWLRIDNGRGADSVRFATAPLR